MNVRQEQLPQEITTPKKPKGILLLKKGILPFIITLNTNLILLFLLD